MIWKNDSKELVNLAVRKEHKEMLHRMRNQLLVEFEQQGAEFLDLLPTPLEKIMN